MCLPDTDFPIEIVGAVALLARGVGGSKQEGGCQDARPATIAHLITAATRGFISAASTRRAACHKGHIRSKPHGHPIYTCPVYT